MAGAAAGAEALPAVPSRAAVRFLLCAASSCPHSQPRQSEFGLLSVTQSLRGERWRVCGSVEPRFGSLPRVWQGNTWCAFPRVCWQEAVDPPAAAAPAECCVCKTVETVLCPGEIIYIPRRWPHYGEPRPLAYCLLPQPLRLLALNWTQQPFTCFGCCFPSGRSR